MICQYCSAEVREGAKYCTQCGMPVTVQPQETATEDNGFTGYENESPKTSYSAPAHDDYGVYNDTYTAGSARYTSGYYDSTADNLDHDRDWMAGVALVCAILSILTFFLVFPAVVLGITAIVFGCLAKNSSLRPLAIGAIVCGIIGIVTGVLVGGTIALFFGLFKSALYYVVTLMPLA